MTDYVELRCRSYYSLLDGTSAPNALVARAAELGMSALGLVDTNNVYGAIFFVEAAKKLGVKPILGASLTLETGYQLPLLVANENGWENLCWLITQAQHHAPKGKACLPLTNLSGHTDGLIALSGNPQQALAEAQMLLELFGEDHFWIELQHHAVRGDRRLIGELVNLAKYLGVGYVATNNVHYVSPDEKRLRDVLVSIRHNTPLDDAEHLHHTNNQYYLKSGKALSKAFDRFPRALQNTLVIAEQCNLELTYGLQSLPAVETPTDLSTHDYLGQLCFDGLRQKIGEISAAHRQQLLHELDVIHRAGLDNYFLIVWDFHQFATAQGIRGQGRGSGANSLVAYALGLTPVDPLKYGLIFERFLSDERPVVPDIDMDYENDRRDEVIDYLYQKYGDDHVARAANYVTFRRRSAVRDVGRMLGLPRQVQDRLADSIDFFDENTHNFGGLIAPETGAVLQEMSQQIAGLPRHLGLHSSGVVLMRQPLSQRLPTEPTRKEGYTVVQADKEVLASAGIVKFDVLGLGILAAISKALNVIEETTGERLDLSQLTYDDPAIYDMITAGDTVTVFQVDSRAQSQTQPILQPRCFEDIMVGISLIRPGPIQGDMVHPYLRRRRGLEAVDHFHPLLAECLSDTLGIILFQEDVLKVAQTLAGFTYGQGELLRRALGAKNATQEIAKFRGDFVSGALKNGVERGKAEMVFEKLLAFGGYSFAKSHAASFAVLVYQSAWLKYYYPHAAYLGNLNSQPLGFWTPAVVVNDIKRHGITVLGPDVNLSDAKCTLDGDAIRVGFNNVKDFGDDASERIVEARGNLPYADLLDFCKRTQLPRRLIQHLILVGAFDWWGIDRRKLLWELGTIDYAPDKLDLEFESEPVDLPPLDYLEMRGIEFHLLGMSLHEHPMEIYRNELAAQGILDSSALQYVPEKQVVRVAGINVVHQAPPTAKGFHFLTLEDKAGFINVIFRPSVYERYQQVVRRNPMLIVEGMVEREGTVTNVLARSAMVMSPLQALEVRTRRFR